MPVALVKRYAAKAKISVAAAEEKWERAKALAREKFEPGSRAYWPYVAGIFKKMIGESEKVTLADFLLLDRAEGPVAQPSPGSSTPATARK